MRSVGGHTNSSVITGGSDGQPHIMLGADDGFLDLWHPSALAVAPNVWYHVVASYDAVTHKAKMYINGSLANGGVFTLSQNLNLGNEIRIGGDPYNDNFMNGMIDDVAIWNRTLSDGEVSQLFSENGVVINNATTNAVPEPSTLALSVLGLLSLLYMKRRK